MEQSSQDILLKIQSWATTLLGRRVHFQGAYRLNECKGNGKIECNLEKVSVHADKKKAFSIHYSQHNFFYLKYASNINCS